MPHLKEFLKKYGVAISLSIILIVSIFERFAYLDSRPDWYIDEGSNVMIAWNLMHGNMTLQGLEQTFVPHFPLFFIIGGIFTLIFGKTILALRLLAATCTIFSTMMLYLIGKELKNSWTGIAIATTFCLMSETLLLTRYGTSSNLATLEILIFLFFILKYSHTKFDSWLYAAAFTSAMIVFTDYFLWGILIIYPLLLWKEKIKLLKVLLISFSLVTVFLLIMLIFKGHWLIEDIQYYFINRPLTSTLNLGAENQTILSRLIEKLISWLSHSPLIIIGLIGLPLLTNKKDKLIIIFSFLALASPIFLYGQSNFISRNQIMLAPFIAIGIVFFGIRSYIIFQKAFFSSTKFKLLLPTLFFLSTLLIIRNDLKIITTLYYKIPPPTIFGGIFFDNKHIKSVADYVNKQVKSEDYVIAPDNISFLINAKTSDVFMISAYEGNFTETTSPDFLSRERFTFDHSPKKALYYIADTSMTNDWAAEHPSTVEVFNQIEQWPAVYQSSKFVVHKNPIIPND